MVYTNNDIEVDMRPHIAVVGVGGAGCNVISSFNGSICDVDTIAINTDRNALHSTSADTKIYICKEVLKGEGARGDAVIGKKCADIHKDEIKAALAGHDVVFVIAGLGGGTGTGAAAVVIDAAQSQNIATFAIAISPFFFEGSRKEVAKEGYRHIRAVCPHSALVDNDLVLQRMPDLNMAQAFAEVNRSIMQYVMDCAKAVEEEFVDTVMTHRPAGMQDRPRSEKEALPISMLMSA